MNSISALQTLVVATDYSDTAKAAALWAARRATARGAKLLLVHAFDPSLGAIPADGTLPMPVDLMNQLQSAARDQLEISAEVLRQEGAAVETRFRIGTAARCVVEAAEEADADLIVAGTRGLTGIAHALLGSTAEQLVRQSPIPVVTLHPEHMTAADPAKAAEAELTRILVPTDFSETAAKALDTAQRLSGVNPSDCRVVLLHAYHLPIEFTSLAGGVPILPNYIADAALAAKKRLETVAEDLRARGYIVVTRAREGYPPRIILEEAKAHDADLIAMPTHGYRGLKHIFMGSSAERVVQKAECPVLTVRIGE